MADETMESFAAAAQKLGMAPPPATGKDFLKAFAPYLTHQQRELLMYLMAPPDQWQQMGMATAGGNTPAAALAQEVSAVAPQPAAPVDPAQAAPVAPKPAVAAPAAPAPAAEPAQPAAPAAPAAPARPRGRISMVLDGRQHDIF